LTVQENEAKLVFNELGFISRRLCPYCGSEALKLSHVDDVGTEWLKCEKCGNFCTKRKSKERRELEEALAKPLEHEAVEFPEKYFEDGTFVPKLLAEELMREYRFITLKDTDQIYVFNDGFYQPFGEILIKSECRKRLGKEYRKNRAAEVVDFIKASTYTSRREEPAYLVPLANGVLNLKTLELQPYNPDLMFFNKLPIKYDPSADCPHIKKFLREIVATEEDVQILLEVIGFCLYREYFIAKALMLVGDGSNGKSTFLNLVKAFLGKENVSSRSLQELEENRFAKADLHHKLANIYADLPDKALFRTGTFKMLTGRDLITAERKFQHSFTFENYAKLLFSANKVPEAFDDSDAFFRRWLIVVFPNQFINDKADPNILQKLTTPEELSGLLNLVLPALKRLLEKGQFSISKTTEEIRQDYIRKSSPIAAFVTDCLEIDSEAFIIKKDLFNAFAEYCRIKNLPVVSQDTFFKNLPKYVNVSDYRPKLGSERPPALKGLRFNLSVSTVSLVSRVFYTLSQRKQEFENQGCEIEEIGDSFIKVWRPPDTIDTLDTKLNQLKKDIGERLGISESSLSTKCENPLSSVSASIPDVYNALREQLKEPFYDHRALDLIMKVKQCDLEDAKKVWQIFIDEGKVFQNSFGLWEWVK